MTFQEIKDELSSYASTLSLSGVAIDKLCSLLAYSIYKNQMLQTRTLLESSFSTSLNLNSRIHHSANLLYSVPRGRCPRISVTNLTGLKSGSMTSTTYYSKLDELMTYNGYYFYFAHDETTVSPNPLELIVAQNAKLSTTKAVTDTIFFVDFSADENVSLDYIITTDSETVLNCTENINEFYDQKLIQNDDAVYIYDVLVVTIPNYGVRVIRRADDASWGTSSLTLTYIPYSEVLPNVSELTTFSGFTHSATWVNSTEITSTEYIARLVDLDLIYSRAIDSFCSKGQIATTADLLAELASTESLEGAYYKVYKDTSFDDDKVESNDPNTTTIVSSNCTPTQLDIMEQLANEWKLKRQLPVSEEIEFRLASRKGFLDDSTYYVKVFSSSSKALHQSSLDAIANSYLPMIGETLTHSRIEADIVRLGYDSVSLYDAEGEEVTPSIVCGKLEYPSPVLRVYIG